ncbi:hypothetical protein FJ661_15935 [Pseudarthrobacter phenanthrenivorans]|uniref:hypothetical protein n=1 Tax=Micrococcaceae TaxID=1268 RepID=UPI0011127049|nr:MULTISPECIES: hypothetical protein [Micrococcaceae]TNB73609.1 hypothetical protein FHJ30_06250 [Arthrobacter sp. BB-1]TPV49428.1 hypothetical protein FJ661_15935 [Pseudarthrobacter phenanthrenivorans]
MSGLKFDERFSKALKEELATRVEQTARSKNRRRALLWGTGTVTGVVGLAGIGAAAAGLFVLPGGEKVTPLGAAVEATYKGSATMDLGAPPEGTTAVQLQLTCLTPGSFIYPDGATSSCTTADLGGALSDSIYSVPYTPGLDHISITTEPETQWKITAKYVNEEILPWERNAKGETYGVINDFGEPDLIAVAATSGQSGYVYKKDLNEANGNVEGKKFSSPEEAMAWIDEHRGKPIPVYDKEGETVVGEFISGR